MRNVENWRIAFRLDDGRREEAYVKSAAIVDAMRKASEEMRTRHPDAEPGDVPSWTMAIVAVELIEYGETA